MGSMVTLESLDGVKVSTFAKSATDVCSIPSLSTVFPNFISRTTVTVLALHLIAPVSKLDNRESNLRQCFTLENCMLLLDYPALSSERDLHWNLK